MCETNLIPAVRIERRILFLRGQKVMLDFDLAELYSVETRVLNQAVKRNLERFPEDFMFQLTWEETKVLLRSQIVILDGETSGKTQEKSRNPRSQSVILESGKNIKFRPFAFTEQGVGMLSGVLNSPRAVQPTSLLSARLPNYGRCCRRTPIWRGSWRHWRGNTTNSFGWCSMPSAR